MRLQDNPSLPNDLPGLVRQMDALHRATAQQVNGLSEGRLAASYQAATAPPTTGSHALGDTVRNSAPAIAGGVGGEYVLMGWICVVAGEPGTWAEIRTPSAAWADSGAITKGYIDGLQMQWVSGTALTVSSGAAYIEASGNIVVAPSAIAKTGLSLSASTWYHVYLYLNAGTPDVEIVTAAPVAYSGTARSKTGDSSRRYLGSIKSDGTNDALQFIQSGTHVLYLFDAAIPVTRILANGISGVRTTVSAAGAVPVTARVVELAMVNTAPSETLFLGVPGGAGTITAIVAGQRNYGVHPLDASQQLDYTYSPAPAASGGYLDVHGYTYER